MKKRNLRNLTSKRLSAAVALLCAAACGGKAVNLDHGAPSSTNTGDAGVTTTAQVDDQIINIWVDDTRLYWQEYAGSLRSCVYDDCKATKLTYASQTSTNITFSADDVFFLNWLDKLFRCSKSGCADKPTYFLQDDFPSDTRPRATADAQYFYWSSTFDIYRCPIANCGDVPDVVAARETGTFLQLQGSELYYSYWPDQFARTDNPRPPEIHRAPLDGSAAPVVVPLSSELPRSGWSSFTTDSQRVYWIGPASQILGCPLTGCSEAEPPVTLADSGTAKSAIAVDASGVYWLEGSLQSDPTQTVMFCPLAGCSASVPPRVLTPNNAARFALDATYLYWSDFELQGGNYTSGRVVRRVVKPTP